ncbi:MAG: M48 family metalloprotease [Tenacibaculum sp.]
MQEIPKVFYYQGLFFLVLFLQIFINYLLSKEKDLSIIKNNLVSITIASLTLGCVLYYASIISNNFDSSFIFYLLLSLTIYAYWFIINPLLDIFLSKKHTRAIEIEKYLKSENQNFKVYFTDKISKNAFATGIVPFYKIIILAKDLKEKLDKSELKAIIYHEIGHHKRKHILIMYALNVVILTSYFIGQSFMVKYNFTNKFYEGFSVFMSGITVGLAVYYIPNKIMYFLEYDADNYSAKKNNKNDIIAALVNLDKLSEGKLTKGNINHPNLEKRISSLNKLN